MNDIFSKIDESIIKTSESKCIDGYYFSLKQNFNDLDILTIRDKLLKNFPLIFLGDNINTGYFENVFNNTNSKKILFILYLMRDEKNNKKFEVVNNNKFTLKSLNFNNYFVFENKKDNNLYQEINLKNTIKDLKKFLDDNAKNSFNKQELIEIKKTKNSLINFIIENFDTSKIQSLK
jgi:hypothetical protein